MNGWGENRETKEYKRLFNVTSLLFGILIRLHPP